MTSLAALREQLRTFERSACHAIPLAFGLPALDACLPAGGLARGALHELQGESDTAIAAVTLFAAGILGRLATPVLWCATRADLFAPGLAAAGLHPDHVLHAWLPNDAAVLLAMEEALRYPALGAVLGEVEKLGMTASRRLVLAAEKSGVTAFVLRRSSLAAPATNPTAAATRWRIAPLPSAPLPVAGIGRARWRVTLQRCRGGRPGTWILEACDAQGRLALPAALPGRTLGTSASGRAA